VGEPLYRQIAEELRSQIESDEGKYSAGDMLPPESELQAMHKASRNTIRGAVNLLTSWGLVITRPGKGTFILEENKPFVTTLSSKWQLEPDLDINLDAKGSANFHEMAARTPKAVCSAPEVRIQGATGFVAQQLDVTEGSSVITRVQRRFVNGQPWSLQTSYYPMSLYLQGAEKLLDPTDIEEGTVEYLGDKLGLKQVGYRDRILVRRATTDESSFLKLGEDERLPVFVVMRTGYADGEGDVKPRIYRLTVGVYPSDRNQFVINTGDGAFQDLTASLAGHEG
jgi:GntR family transcriptional regulator